jgi:hypothetical protein
MGLRKKTFVLSFMAVMFGIAGGEIFARYSLGLSTPPLYMEHPKIEYMLIPNQDVHRFGNRIIINQYGMRSMPFTEKKDDGEFRIMVFGDSVINSGNLMDHGKLATTILQDELGKAKERVVVGNVSAGSWGPGNWLAYAEEFGFFGADIIVVIISSHDYVDNPTFQTLNKNFFPTERPISAILEGITRYLPRYLLQVFKLRAYNEPDSFEKTENEQEVLKGLSDLRRFLELSKNNSTNVLVLQAWEKSELEQGLAKPGHQRIKEVCESIGISPISLEGYFRRSIENGKSPYLDKIHPNRIGQQLIAEAIIENLPNTALE